MNSTASRLARTCVAGSLSLVLAVPPAVAATPKNLDDLVYQDTGWGGGQLRSRGYTLIESDQRDGETWQYWYDGRSRTCVQAKSEGGKYQALNVTANTDCNQYDEESNKGDNAAALAIGAAALIGVAALAHKSHERDKKHSTDEQSLSEFDRGYRDGLHHERYHDYNDSSAYADGYNAGQRKRDAETSYRSNSGHHSGKHSYVVVSDLVGDRASTADSELRSRGFTDTGGYKKGGSSYTTWYNRSTHQCVQARTRDGRIDNFENVAEDNCR